MLGSYLFFAFIVALVLIIFSYAYYAIKMGCPTFPTLPSMRRKMIDVIKEDAKNSSSRPYTVIDLGSGSGQLSRNIARALPQAKVIGIELSLVPWLRSCVHQRIFGPSNVEYKRVNFWPYDISTADALITYLMDSQMDGLSEKFRKELKSGAMIIASKRSLSGDWRPFKTYDIEIPAMLKFLPLPTKLRLYRQFAAANHNEKSAPLSSQEDYEAAVPALAQAAE